MKTNEENFLAKFYEQKIFDLDEDEVEGFLSGFEEEEIIDCFIKRLQFITSSKDDIDDVSWKFGRIFGIYKKISMDGVLIKEFASFSATMKIACLNFLSGYWDEAIPNMENLKLFLNLVTESIVDNNSPLRLKELSVEAIAVLYGNNKFIFSQDDDMLKKVHIVNSYAATSLTDYPGKSLLNRLCIDD